MVVDDDVVIRKLLRQMLHKLVPHREIVEVGDGSEAVNLCAKGTQFALVIMDLEMPKMDGDIAASRIRRMYPSSGAGAPPIIAMTAHTLGAEALSALHAAGILEVVIKPPTKDVLRGLLTTYRLRPSGGTGSGGGSLSLERGRTLEIDLERRLSGHQRTGGSGSGSGSGRSRSRSPDLTSLRPAHYHHHHHGGAVRHSSVDDHIMGRPPLRGMPEMTYTGRGGVASPVRHSSMDDDVGIPRHMLRRSLLGTGGGGNGGEAQGGCGE
ncbi:hypothetical protein HK104_005594 [Borealophlyctis nickersoniae]|nr:hypothetical protein HK104_005594 [Borealophlyctis nickersoniae]